MNHRLRKNLAEVQRAERMPVHRPDEACALLEECIALGGAEILGHSDSEQETWIARSYNTLIDSLGGQHELCRLFYKRQRTYEAFNSTTADKAAAIEEMGNILAQAHSELSIRCRANRKPERPSPQENAAIFVVHGRDERLRRAMFDFLQSLGLKPLEWATMVSETKNGAPFIGAILDAGMSKAQAVVVMFTPDDEARLRNEFLLQADGAHERILTPQPRPNVLFEAGLAFGRHPESTILVQIGDMRPFSDIAGRHLIRMDNSAERRLEFANRLKTVGCKIDLDAGRWITAGDFTVKAGAPEPMSRETKSTADDSNS